MTATQHEPGLHIDPWGRATLRTHAGSFYSLHKIGERATVADVDLCLAVATDTHPEDVDALLDARLVIQAEEVHSAPEET